MRTMSLVLSVALALLAGHGGMGAEIRDVKIDLPRRPKDGMGDVRKASDFGVAGKWDEGRKFVAALRGRPSDGMNLEERQSVDMAEFALLRHSFETNRTRCVECLKSVYDAGCTSFWGWAAYSYLKEYGEDVKEPLKDSLRGIGAFGDGVVNLVPKLLVTGNGERIPRTKRVAKGDALAGVGTGDGCQLSIDDRIVSSIKAVTNAFAISSHDDLKPGSPVRRAILRKRLVDICGEEKICEILSAKGGDMLFARLWEDDATLEDFLLSGPVFDAPLALETLMTLFLNDENEKWSKTPMGRRAAVAVAVNAQKGDDLAATVRHWAAFRRIGLAGRFAKETEKYDCREWRFIVRRPADPADILYLNAIVDFPRRYITNLSIRNVPYRKQNCFGSKMFLNRYKRGGDYYRPWMDAGWPAAYLYSRVGGVCVEQANWAALCANAHGRLALSANQPGRPAVKFITRKPPHLCWLLRDADGSWRIVNGITSGTKPRFSLWGKGFQYMLSVERAFADRAAHDESELLLFVGRVREAAMRCPYNWPAWRAYTDELKAPDASVEEWRRYLGEIVELQPEGRLVSWDFAHEALDALAAKGMKKNALAQETVRVFAGLPQPKSKIAEEMNFEKDALGRAMKRFRGFRALEDEVLDAALVANKECASYLPQVFAYAIKRFAKDKKRLGAFFAKAGEVLGGSGDETAGEKHKEGGEANWRRLCSVKGCGENREAFRMMADLRNEDDPPTGTATVPQEDYGAPLASGDALVGISSGGRGDTPEDYARVSDATPYDPDRKGLFTTRAEDAPWAVVELAGATVVKGVTVIGAESNLVAWIAGEDGEWREVGGGTLKDDVMRLEIGGEPQPVRSVKVGFRPEAGKKVLCLKKILVYGERQF